MKKILIISLLLISGRVFGQGIQAEVYQYNYSFIHPAFAGSEGQRISMLACTASSYDGNFGDQKQAMLLMSYENYFEKIRSGVAVTGYSERLGTSSLSSFALSYNYRMNLGSSTDLITSARIHRNFHSISADYYRVIDPSDPLLDVNFSASNWAADLGLLLRVREYYVGLLANNLLHTNNRIDLTGSRRELENDFAAVIGTSFTINEHLAAGHSLYIPFDDEGYRVDLNNTLTINDIFLAGLSVERSGDKFFARGNAGLKVKDYFQIVFLVYSGKRDYIVSPKFRGEVFIGFSF